MNEFIIVFRESLEACLIVGIIYTLLEKNNLAREIKQLWLGVFFALIAMPSIWPLSPLIPDGISIDIHSKFLELII